MSENQETRKPSDDDRRQVRRSKLVSASGPGSVVKIGRESFAICDTSLWVPEGETAPDVRFQIRLDRLADMLEVSGLYSPPIENAEEEANRRQGHRNRDWSTRVPAYRFPRWLACTNRDCNRLWWWGRPEEERLGPGRWNGERDWLERWSRLRDRDTTPNCPHCADAGEDYLLQPYPNVVVCSKGHLSDLPLGKLVHNYGKASGDAPSCEFRHELRYLRGTQALKKFGVKSAVLECEICKRWLAENDIIKRSDPEKLKRLNLEREATGGGPLDPIEIWCDGKQPWLKSRVENCGIGTHFYGADKNRVEIVPLRHAGPSLYVPTNASAIDIPPDAFRREISDAGGDSMESRKAFQELVEGLRLNRSEWQESRIARRLLKDLHREFRLPQKKILDQALTHVRDNSDEAEVDFNVQVLRAGEFGAFIDAEQPPDLSFARFIVEKVPHASEACEEGDPLGLIGSIRLVNKLRIVRALQGFTRLGGPVVEDGESKQMTPPHLHHDCNWLPAIESIGEGIFLSLAEDQVAAWETECQKFIAHRLNGIFGPGSDPDDVPWTETVDPPRLPRFVLLHTLSHLLQRQLAFESGYAASSLGEVIYASTNEQGRMAGILIYTMEGDERGGMGGLVRLGRPGELRKILTNALMQADWCSNDPICASRERQGPGRRNRAACHACALVNETSCSHQNEYLDRLLLINRRAGFFRKALLGTEQRSTQE